MTVNRSGDRESIVYPNLLNSAFVQKKKKKKKKKKKNSVIQFELLALTH